MYRKMQQSLVRGLVVNKGTTLFLHAHRIIHMHRKVAVSKRKRRKNCPILKALRYMKVNSFVSVFCIIVIEVVLFFVMSIEILLKIAVSSLDRLSSIRTLVRSNERRYGTNTATHMHNTHTTCHYFHTNTILCLLSCLCLLPSYPRRSSHKPTVTVRCRPPKPSPREYKTTPSLPPLQSTHATTPTL